MFNKPCKLSLRSMNHVCPPPHLLVADLGGTHCRYAQVNPFKTSFPLPDVRTVNTADFSSFAELTAVMYQDFGPSDAAILAVPGTELVPGYVHCPNIPWPVDLRTAPSLPAQTRLINDLAAQGWACLAPEGQQLHTVLEGTVLPSPRDRKIRTVIGPGTGLGACVVVTEAGHTTVLASELGHTLFPLLPDEADFARFALARGQRLDGDHLLSGRGLSTLHAFFTHQECTPKDVTAHMLHTPVLEWYARFLGRMCQTAALATLCLDGLYICGGIIAANIDLVCHPAFVSAFYDCPAQSEVLQSIPVQRVCNTNSALCGVILYARQHYSSANH